jgi:hypothetical protein
MKENQHMPLLEADVYYCPDTANCGTEVTVTKPALPTCPVPEVLTCCGKTMIKKRN